MSNLRVGRNAPCPCGSGRKFKNCCMLRGAAFRAGSSVDLSPQPAQRAGGSAFSGPTARGAPPQQYSTAFDDLPPKEADDQPDPPPPDTVPLLPVEVGLDYTYPEQFGQAEVTYILPAGQTLVLADGKPIINDYLKPGMRVLLKDGAIAIITAVKLYYEPPEPPSHQENGLVLSRVVGTVKHKGLAVTDVSWPGYTATSTPNHLYYSVSRQDLFPHRNSR
jgi:SEC-C motif